MVLTSESDVDAAAGDRTAVLEVRDVVKRYGDRTAVDRVGFTIGPGECLGLLGPNGAGKTTTILMVVGLLRPDAGSALVGPRRLGATDRAARRLIGYVPQEVAVYDDLTGRENLRFFAALSGVRGRAGRARADEVLDTVALRDRADDRVATYSGGMKRRLNIAVALLHRPSLLVLDEPTVGVDPQSRNSILDRLAHLRDDGLALLYSSHYMEEVERLATRVAIIDEGRVLAAGTRRDLVAGLGAAERVRLTCRDLPDDVVDRLAGVAGVDAVHVHHGALELRTPSATAALPSVLTVLAAAGVEVSDLSVDQPDLESVFLHLTGKALRDV